MKYFKAFSATDIVNIITSTKKSLFLCLPSIHEEIEEAISYLDYSSNHDKKEVDIHIIIDFDAQTFRQGYGNFSSVNDLIDDGFEIKCLKDNRISFIISDDIGYYLFIESRSLIPADKATINAVNIDPVSIVRLKNYFYANSVNFDFQDELANAIIEESKTLNKPNELISQEAAKVEIISKHAVEKIETELEKNPPLNPDYKRLVEYYSNKFQYVKLIFEGANINHQKIKIPAKALPIMDASLKNQLETKLNLFDKNQEAEGFKSLNDFNTKLTAIRDKYLTTIKARSESVLSKTSKTQFETEINNLKTGIESVQKEIINNISAQIEQAKERLLKDLIDFFINNPKAIFPNHPNLWEGSTHYIEKESQSIANEIIYHIKWPRAHLLVDKLKLTLHFSDITFEDLKNEEFINELFEKGLISEANKGQLANFGEAISLKYNG